jgi:putative Mg2+ transporter-C (MgtC) family protein
LDISISSGDVAIRLGCTVIASLIIGIDREEHGRPAGLRTTMLVCLAASGAMLLANLLADTGGKPWDSYVTMDAMRLPLGILTGVGFIGAGAILHKDNLVLGVTTAATLWFATVMGLCYGAGELGLGTALLAVGAGVLWGLRWVEKHCWHRIEATISVTVKGGEATEDEIRNILRMGGYAASVVQAEWAAGTRHYRFDVHRHVSEEDAEPPAELIRLAEREGIEVTWARHP